MSNTELNTELNIELNNDDLKPSFCGSKNETEFLNFTYILYNEKACESDEFDFRPAPKDELNLYNLILKYHYPCCMNIHTLAILSDNEKQMLINNEVLLFKQKIDEYNKINKTSYNFLQIPRILYDLCVILFVLDGMIGLKEFSFGGDMRYFNYDEYCGRVDKYHSELVN